MRVEAHGSYGDAGVDELNIRTTDLTLKDCVVSSKDSLDTIMSVIDGRLVELSSKLEEINRYEDILLKYISRENDIAGRSHRSIPKGVEPEKIIESHFGTNLHQECSHILKSTEINEILNKKYVVMKIGVVKELRNDVSKSLNRIKIHSRKEKLGLQSKLDSEYEKGKRDGLKQVEKLLSLWMSTIRLGVCNKTSDIYKESLNVKKFKEMVYSVATMPSYNESHIKKILSWTIAEKDDLVLENVVSVGVGTYESLLPNIKNILDSNVENKGSVTKAGDSSKVAEKTCETILPKNKIEKTSVSDTKKERIDRNQKSADTLGLQRGRKLYSEIINQGGTEGLKFKESECRRTSGTNTRKELAGDDGHMMGLFTKNIGDKAPIQNKRLNEWDITKDLAVISVKTSYSPSAVENKGSDKINDLCKQIEKMPYCHKSGPDIHVDSNQKTTPDVSKARDGQKNIKNKNKSRSQTTKTGNKK